ncbi:hypothetical protein Bbelb_427740 [Branchiostoma belcheri]|nr:hypothetical protein Bbelb_427740 [Branchiostoma belcheri]
MRYQNLKFSSTFDLTGFPCPDPGVPTNGYRIGDTFDEWSVVTFGCEDGYMLLGQQNLTCVSGHWNFSPPRCSVCVPAERRNINDEEGEITSPHDVETGRYQNNTDCGDADVSRTGFKLNYKQQNKSEDGDTGAFSSMNYPNYPYRNHVYQQWNIAVDTHKAVKLTFEDFDIDLNQGCEDYVIAHDPDVEAHWCGTCVPSPKTSTGNRLNVIFVTDFVIRRAGFSARYKAVEKGQGSATPDDLLSRSDWFLVSGKIKQISISSSTNQVWALDDEGRPLRRTGVTKMVPQGTGWEVVGIERFLQISVGRVGVWAVYNHSTVMYRVGTYGNKETAGLGWRPVQIDSVNNYLFNFEKLAVETSRVPVEIDWLHSGKNFVWVIGTDFSYKQGEAIVRKGISPGTPEGKTWETVGAANIKQVSVSSRTGQLWAVELGHRVWRSPFYCEITMKYDWESTDGCLQPISVGRVGVWAVDREGDVYHRAGTFWNETSPGEGWVHVPGVTLQQVEAGDEKRLCAEDEIICPHSGKCIPDCSVCDGVVDCGEDDGSDERNCCKGCSDVRTATLASVRTSERLTINMSDGEPNAKAHMI